MLNPFVSEPRTPEELAAWASRDDAGQTTPEYALVVAVAGLIAVAVMAVAPGQIVQLFGKMIKFILERLPG